MKTFLIARVAVELHPGLGDEDVDTIKAKCDKCQGDCWANPIQEEQAIDAYANQNGTDFKALRYCTSCIEPYLKNAKKAGTLKIKGRPE